MKTISEIFIGGHSTSEPELLNQGSDLPERARKAKLLAQANKVKPELQQGGYLIKKGIPSFNQMAKNLISRFKK